MFSRVFGCCGSIFCGSCCGLSFSCVLFSNYEQNVYSVLDCSFVVALLLALHMYSVFCNGTVSGHVC